MYCSDVAWLKQGCEGCVIDSGAGVVKGSVVLMWKNSLKVYYAGM
jgi:hypothetical protein